MYETDISASSADKSCQTSKLTRTSIHVNKPEKKSNCPQKYIRRSTQKSPSVPLPPTSPTRLSRQKNTTEKRKSDRTRLSIQSHIARLSGGTRDGIVDKKKKSEEESKDHPQKKRGKIQQSRCKERQPTPKIRVEKTQHSRDRVEECHNVKGGVKRNPKSANEKKKETKIQKVDGIIQSVETKLGNLNQDETIPKPDSSWSGTESECCYSTDPDWDTSVWSESSSDDNQPDPNAVRAKDTIIESNGDIEISEDTSNDESNSSRDRSFGFEDNHYKTSCMDKPMTKIDVKDNLKTRRPYRSACDGSLVESESSYSPQSSDTDLVSEEKIVTISQEGLTKSVTRQKHTRYRQKNKRKQNMKSPVDRQPKDTNNTRKANLKRVIDRDKIRFEDQNQKRFIGTRRVQSEFVVREYRHEKQKSSPTLRIDPTEERGRKKVRDEKGFVYEKGKGKDIVNKGKETEPVIERGKQMGFVNNRGKGRDKISKFDGLLNTQINHTEPKRRSNDTKSFHERGGKSFDRMNKNMTVRNDKYKSKVERKSAVRFTLPNKELYNVYSQESAISSDEAMICDGYSESSSASSIMSEVISDTGDYNSEINSLVETTILNNETRGCIGDDKSLRSKRKSGKKSEKCEKKSNGESESQHNGQQNRSQSTKVTDQPKPSDMIHRKKSLIIKECSTKEIQKKPSVKIVKCQSAKQITVVADRVPSKLRMYAAPVSSHPKSESELLKYVEFQANKVKPLKPGGDREFSRRKIKIVQSGDKMRRTTAGKTQMKTTATEKGGHASTRITKQNQEVYRNRIIKGAEVKSLTSESSCITAREAGKITQIYYTDQETIINRDKWYKTGVECM